MNPRQEQTENARAVRCARKAVALRQLHTSPPVKGALRVWWIPQVPGDPFYVPVASLIQAKLVLKTLADYDLFQLANHIKPDYSNAGGLETFDGEEWTEWEGDEGQSIDEWEPT